MFCPLIIYHFVCLHISSLCLVTKYLSWFTENSIALPIHSMFSSCRDFTIPGNKVQLGNSGSGGNWGGKSGKEGKYHPLHSL